MKSWLRAKQALTALDVVMRRWGRQLGLDEVELVLVMLLGEVRGRCGADLAELSGRSRQNVNRSLFALRERGLVEAKVDHRGRAQWWWLSASGLQTLAALEARMVDWETTFSDRVDLRELSLQLVLLVESLVRRGSSSGWARALVRPASQRWDPKRELEELMKEIAVGAPKEPRLVPVEKNAAGARGPALAIAPPVRKPYDWKKETQDLMDELHAEAALAEQRSRTNR